MPKIENIDGVENLIPTEEGSVRGFTLIDVRRPDEFSGELGHIKGAKLVTLGQELHEFLEEAPRDEKYLFICRSGGRSTQACLLAESMGFSDVTNLKGGMLHWNDLALKTNK
jgi:rhodanese-related sulfurtransferase